jgi:hypothetical protein
MSETKEKTSSDTNTDKIISTPFDKARESDAYTDGQKGLFDKMTIDDLYDMTNDLLKGFKDC